MGIFDNLISKLSVYSELVLGSLNIFGKEEFVLDDTLGLATHEDMIDTEIQTVTLKADQVKNEAGKGLEKVKVLKEKTLKKIEAIRAKCKSGRFVKNKDKITFLVMGLRIFFELFALGRWPCQFPMIYSLTAIVLISARWVYYRMLRWHYFLLEFCYYANFLLVLYFTVWPDSAMLYSVVFGFANGPLFLSVPIFGNSLVFHYIDKVTSNFIHLNPSLALWSIRSTTCVEYPELEVPSFLTYALYSCIFYLSWCLVYYIIMFKLAYERWNRKNNLTLYTWQMDLKGAMYKFSGLLGEKRRIPMFMLSHFITFASTLVPTYLAMVFFEVQTAMVIFIILVSLWNAACYYMEIFAKTYQLKINQLDELKESIINAED